MLTLGFQAANHKLRRPNPNKVFEVGLSVPIFLIGPMENG
jgi:hypothetical protein